MKCGFVLSVLALAGSVLAWGDCADFDATGIVNSYINILEQLPSTAAANATAQALLVDDYSETSDSILMLEGLPLTTPPFVGKEYYISGIVNSPAYTGIETILIVPACGYITWHWIYTAIGSAEYRIKGFHLFEVTESGQLASARLEFNSIAWGTDMGYTVTPPSKSG